MSSETVTTPEQQPKSVARASGGMAIATIVSRVTGLLAKLMLASALAIGEALDSYTVANTLPTVINELLLGGVLTSIAIPLLVRAQKEDEDRGESYAQWMITMGTVLLAVATAVSVALAPALTRLYMDDTTANAELATLFAYLILPGIIFYGLSALLGAVLNAKEIFGPPAWAPVMNNVVVIATIAVYMIVPGEISLNPVHMGDVKVLVLGIGTALGVAVQTAVMVPSLLRSGFRFRWHWGWDRRLSEFGGLAMWVLLYTIVSQVGMVVTLQVASQGTKGSVSIFTYAWLLSQVPYGVLGVSLLTALMPRMSRAAADHDNDALIRDLAFGNRMSSVLLMPISALMTIAGPAIGIVLFTFGKNSSASAEQVGIALALSAFGLVPFAITMMQLRVFYALKDSRTPTLINAIMVAFRVAACYWFLANAEADELAVGVSVAMSLSFVVGAIVGQVWLRIRLGRLRTGYTVWTVCLTVVASAIACAVAMGAAKGLISVLGITSPVSAAWVKVVVESLIVLGLSFGLLAVFRVPELKPAVDKIIRLVRRR
ncbi:lipid II flippase MurJ [Lentzea sp. NBRC 105346]|uniref:murein biosynthesis integral membrane protein MurJ n=1 Tax=Lentzea sp. NBRC 105346 TaxID=3032205 RepID=UPI0024A3A324|nr:murein biosynthesis integral membrane protein MurJ [Lentzea sp. NBRC 105346]GLZ33041.1 lipid II flippase MurJ [Lentzea sp. NBRC 105346]